MLQITDNNGIFQLSGNLVAGSTSDLKNHINHLLDRKENVIISLDKIESIDINGVNVLKKLYKKAISNNVLFYVIGRENKKIAKYINSTMLQFIVRRDNL
ncbi:MAG: STAS domain-containing protein [Flavobacteriaceae bacterium]|nr:STAS domain-containing protein [Flavobacteriaceae bacterium]